MTQKTLQCTQCHSENIRKNGLGPNHKQKFHCKDCNKYGVLNPEPRYSDAEKENALRVYQEKGSLRAVERTLGISRHTVSKWLKKSQSSS